MNRITCILVAVLFYLSLSVTGVRGQANKVSWVEDSFEDFADGQLDAAGQNIYVSRDGKIRTIHRFDLNDDGYIDLIFNSASDEYENVRATLGSVAADRKVQASELAVEGSLQAETADLNNDGWLDMVFRPNSISRFLTIIWGGPDGWPAHRSNGLLAVNAPKDLTIADINQDGWPDIIVLNSTAWLPGQPEGNIIRVFWGSEQGYQTRQSAVRIDQGGASMPYWDTGIVNAIALASGDFDRNGAGDVAVLRSDSVIEIIWGHSEWVESADWEKSTISLPADPGLHYITAADCDNDKETDLIMGSTEDMIYVVTGQTGRSWDEPKKISGVGASHIVVDDLDGDSYADIVATCYRTKRIDDDLIVAAEERADAGFTILWGNAEGFSSSRSTAVTASEVTATAVGDFDGDGNHDVAAAIRHDGASYATNSYIYFGKGKREFERAGEGIPTCDPLDVKVITSPNHPQPYLIFSNNQGGNVLRNVFIKLYLGGAEGFSPDRVIEIPYQTAEESTAADFNADGYIDLLVTCTMHGLNVRQKEPYAGANIFWGRPEGIDFFAKLGERRTVLPEIRITTTNTADLNKDGFLDIVMAKEGEELVIYYGAEDGYSAKRRSAFSLPGVVNSTVIADLDKDQWLDVAVAPSTSDWGIFYGSPEGFDKNRYVSTGPVRLASLETADLNEDGWLDMIGAVECGSLATECDHGTYIYWGSPEGFTPWNIQRLPGYYAVSPVVADFDRDGYLDIFNPYYLGIGTREDLPCYLFWNGPEGFDPQRRTVLSNNSAIDGLAADFNRDGLLDLAVPNHRTDGTHYTFSRVFYNDGNRFFNPRTERLPTQGCHYMWDEDLGHIYNRKYQQYYESSLFTWNQPVKAGRLEYVADIPEGTSLVFSFRSADRQESLGDQPWHAVTSEVFPVAPTDRCLQYRALFISDNGDRYPILDRLSVVLSTDF